MTGINGGGGIQADRRDSAEVAWIDAASAGYGSRKVLHGVSVTLRSGQVFALLGPNGAGKSTLIRLLTQTLAPQSGAVRSDARGIGLVPQDIALYSWLTPRENCLAFAGLDGLPRREAKARVEQALTLTRCVEIADTPVARLSGGFQRRANIAVALMRSPSLLILDEPTAGLDADAKRVIRDIILGVRASGAAVLLVSHELDLIDSVADSVGVLVAGQFVANGSVSELMKRLFSTSRVVELVLHHDPNASDIATLRTRGAIAGPSTRGWILLQQREAGNADALLRELSTAGLEIRELRFREPTIADAYSLLTQGAAA